MPSSSTRSRVPSSLLIALVLAVGLGSATATAATPLTVHAVKKIAAKMVRKQAGRLTVANAGRLGGRTPAAYVDRAVMTDAGNQLSLQGSGSTQALLGPVTISVPDGVGGLVIEAASTFNSGIGTSGESLTIFEAVDQGCTDSAAVSGHPQQSHVDPGVGASVSLAALVTVAPGDHAVRLCATSTNIAGFAVARTLVVSTVGEASVVGGPTS
jgi:hypothetical protein